MVDIKKLVAGMSETRAKDALIEALYALVDIADASESRIDVDDDGDGGIRANGYALIFGSTESALRFSGFYSAKAPKEEEQPAPFVAGVL